MRTDGQIVLKTQQAGVCQMHQMPLASAFGFGLAFGYLQAARIALPKQLRQQLHGEKKLGNLGGFMGQTGKAFKIMLWYKMIATKVVL